MILEFSDKPLSLGVLLFGLLCLLIAAIETFTGKAHGRGWTVEEAKNPVGYWVTVVVKGLFGAGLLLFWALALQN